MVDFIKALNEQDLKKLSMCEKSDLHSHAGRGGSVKYIADWANVEIALPPTKFESLSHMQRWYSENIKPHCVGLRGHLKRWEAAFYQAKQDGIKVLAMSFAPDEVEMVGGMDSFINILTEYHHTFSNDTMFLPELAYDRACNVEQEIENMDELLSHGYFKSIDICCNEFAQPIKNFKYLYRKALSYGLKLIAHVGEFGTADDVMEAVEELELNEVHHGIAAANSDFIMNWLANHKIQLNVCPTSNVMLGLVENYKVHPIRKLYSAGIPVTINTDDLLIFNQTISQEYMNLYNCGLLSAEELDEIRRIGLSEVEFGGV